MIYSFFNLKIFENPAPFLYNNIMKERISWIDVARGIGIILVIYGHTLGSSGHRYLIYSFHMPLFFFLSGLVFRSRSGETYKQSLMKDIKRIMIPYFIFAFASLFLWFIILPPENQTSSTILKQFIGILYGNASHGYLAINTVLWFLPCLFITKQIFWFLSKLPKNLLAISLIGFSIIGYISSLYFSNLRFPYGFETALTGIVFFGMGYLWNFIPEKININLDRYIIFLTAIFAFLTIYFADLNWQIYGLQIDLRLNRLNNYFYFYIAAISGILATIFISKIIDKNRLLEYLGRNTMPLFIWHYFVFIYLNRLFFMIKPPQEIIDFRNEYYTFIYTTLAIIIILAATETYRRAKLRLLSTKF